MSIIVISCYVNLHSTAGQANAKTESESAHIDNALNWSFALLSLSISLSLQCVSRSPSLAVFPSVYISREFRFCNNLCELFAILQTVSCRRYDHLSAILWLMNNYCKLATYNFSCSLSLPLSFYLFHILFTNNILEACQKCFLIDFLCCRYLFWSQTLTTIAVSHSGIQVYSNGIPCALIYPGSIGGNVRLMASPHKQSRLGFQGTVLRQFWLARSPGLHNNDRIYLYRSFDLCVTPTSCQPACLPGCLFFPT